MFITDNNEVWMLVHIKSHLSMTASGSPIDASPMWEVNWYFFLGGKESPTEITIFDSLDIEALLLNSEILQSDSK